MEEMLENYYNLYSSCAWGTRRRPWYVALRRTGRPRRGRHTRKKQKSSHFLVIHFDEITKSSNSGAPRNALYAKPDTSNWLRRFTSGWNPPPEQPSSSPKILAHPQLTLSEILSNSLSSKWPARQMYEQFKRKQFKKLERLVAHSPRLSKDESATYQTINGNSLDDSHSMPLTSEEIRLFRNDRRRSRRLIREEKRRERRRLQLESLRNQTRIRAPKRWSSYVSIPLFLMYVLLMLISHKKAVFDVQNGLLACHGIWIFRRLFYSWTKNSMLSIRIRVSSVAKDLYAFSFT